MADRDRKDHGRGKGEGKKERRLTLPAEVSLRVEEVLKEMESAEVTKLGPDEEIPIFETTTPLWYIAYKTAI